MQRIVLAGLAALLICTSGAAKAQISDDVVKIGVLTDMSGPASTPTGPGSVAAAEMAVADFGGTVLGKPIAAVSLLEVCVFTSGAQGKIMAALDAGRSEVYVGEYEIPGKPGSVSREHLLNRSEFLSKAQGWQIVTPDSSLAEVARAAGLFIATLPPISAADVARLGWRKIQSGEIVTPEQLEANYIRRTDAELLDKIAP